MFLRSTDGNRHAWNSSVHRCETCSLHIDTASIMGSRITSQPPLFRIGKGLPSIPTQKLPILPDRPRYNNSRGGLGGNREEQRIISTISKPDAWYLRMKPAPIDLSIPPAPLFDYSNQRIGHATIAYTTHKPYMQRGPILFRWGSKPIPFYPKPVWRGGVCVPCLWPAKRKTNPIWAWLSLFGR